MRNPQGFSHGKIENKKRNRRILLKYLTKIFFLSFLMFHLNVDDKTENTSGT